jgi:hypothetical protein
MKHLEPQPRQGHPTAAPHRRSNNSTLKLAVIALALALGGGGILSALFSPVSGDNLSQPSKERLISDFAAVQSFKISPVVPAETIAAINTMNLTPQQARQLRARVQASANGSQLKTDLAWLELWDFAEQDGDVVHISSAGFELDYPIANIPNRIAIPIDATAIVKVRGVSDGGGGITVGIKSGAMSTSLPVLTPGQTLLLPVTF